MRGQDSYASDANPPLPTGKYSIRFIDAQQRQHVVEVDPDKIPYGPDGRPGSLLDIALGHGIEIVHACGGVCACGTCHVIVREGLATCNEASEAEEDQLDEAYGLTANSRLGCQCVPDGTQNLTVKIPPWNRNLAREQHD